MIEVLKQLEARGDELSRRALDEIERLFRELCDARYQLSKEQSAVQVAETNVPVSR